jgi:sigma-E factor negative regulatory protein RseB
MRASLLTLATYLMLGPPGVGGALAADPRAMLERMELAIETLNYEGTFVHIMEEHVETMHVVHRVADGKITERLVSLDGPGREIIRDADEVKCIFAAEKSVVVERRQGDSPLRAAVPRYTETLDEFYSFAMLRPVTRLGRRVEAFTIRPRDSFRYGYRLWMDQATGMPLKAQLLDEYGKVVEQLMFVSIDLPDAIPAERLEPTIPADGFTWYVRDERKRADERRGKSRWVADRVPPGFELRASNLQLMAGAEWPTDHLVYSDGIASVSVFIEPAGVKE